MKIKKGDNVIVSVGKSRGKKGKVLRVLPKENRLIVEGANLIKRRERPRKQGQKGQVVDIAAPLAVSKVRLWCATCGRGVRIGSLLVAGAKKRRICRSCQKEI